MTDRYTFPGANSATQAGPKVVKQVAIGNGEYIGIYLSPSGKWMVRDADRWVQPCGSEADAEAELGRLIAKHLERIALHALGVANAPDDS